MWPAAAGKGCRTGATSTDATKCRTEVAERTDAARGSCLAASAAASSGGRRCTES